MKRYELCCVGHITLDKVVTSRKTVHMPGGISYLFLAGGCTLLDRLRSWSVRVSYSYSYDLV